MSDLSIIIGMALVTYASRAAFLLRPRPLPSGAVGRFLEVFPLALFVSLATLGLAAPDGEPALGVELWAAAGGVAGAVLTKRSLLGIMVFGGAAWWLARSLT